MNADLNRLKQDVQTIQTAMGLDVWTRRDVRRGFLGLLSGAIASLLLAIWMFSGGAPEAGMAVYLVILQGIIILKAVGYRKNLAPSAGTQREVSFYNRYYFTGTAIITAFFFWGHSEHMELQVLFASCVVMAGMWYLFYGLSAPSRSLAFTGAVPLILGGFILPRANDFSQMFGWLAIAACVGCSLEAALLFVGLRQKGSPENPPASAQTPVSLPPAGPLPAHVAH
jgi:hypothetical protein